MEYYRDTCDTYQEEMKTWAARVNWTVTWGSSYVTLMRPTQQQSLITKKTSIRSINPSNLSNVASSTSDEESLAIAGSSGKGRISAKSSSRRTLKRRTRVSRDNDSGSDSGTGTDIEQDVAQSSPIGWIHLPNIASHELQKDVSGNILFTYP